MPPSPCAAALSRADYKRYVLPLIFLRFLSLRFEKRHVELLGEIADPKSDLHTTDKQLALDILNDADNYTSKQTFLVPEDARWDNIVKIARADDIKSSSSTTSSRCSRAVSSTQKRIDNLLLSD